MKKPFIIGSIIVVIIGVTGVLFGRSYLLHKATPAIQPTTTPVVEEMVTRVDPAGFSFQYPKTLQLNPHDEDTQNYAHLEFTSPTHTGSMVIWEKDTTYPDVTTWMQKDATLKNSTSIDTTLGGKPAKRLILNGSTKMIITGVMDDDVLLTVEITPGEDETFWQTIYGTVGQTFMFVKPTDEESSSAPASTQDTTGVDEEEVLE